MKPFDGGAVAGREPGRRPAGLHAAYDDSRGDADAPPGDRRAYEDFARALSIGPETMVMEFRPEEPMHDRYAVNHGFLSDGRGQGGGAISRIVNAFFHWEFNSARCW